MHDTKLEMLYAYLRAGWALVPLHDVGGVLGGACSCRAGATCKSAGKHPRAERWQTDGQLVREHDTLAAVHAARPLGNWGVATGAASGLWVLDYDPAHADDDAHRFVARLASDGYPPNVMTGGGGFHWYWAWDDGAEIRNLQGSRRLPPGLDVRGTGGQVVAPPSVSAKGAYRWLHAPAGVTL